MTRAGQDPQTAEEFPLPPAMTASHRRRGLAFLALASASVGFAMSVQMGAQSNFVADEMGLSGFQQGLLEAVRETCGIWALGIVALLAGLAEPLVAAMVLVVFSVGLSAYSIVPDYLWLIVASLVWSQGLHVWMPLPHSMTLALAEPERRGYRLGQVHAAGAVGAAGGLLVAQALALTGAEVRWLFLPAGATGLLAAGFCLGIPRDIKTPGPRLVVRRSYRLYYLLSFLEGWRKQIFVAFAGFLLVERHGVPLTTMLWLWIATNAIRWVVSPMIGRWIDRIGERPVLTFYFASLTVFFAGYALIDHVPTLMVIFVIDNAYFAFAAALTSYVGKVAPPEDHTPTLSMGVACNHVAAVSMPLVGGVLWHVAGYQWAFVLGAAAAAGSILAVRRLPEGPAGVQADRNSPADSADMKVTTDEGREI